MIDLVEIGRKLRAVREQLALSSESVAELTGLSSSFIEAMEQGTVTLSGDQLLIFCDVYSTDYKFFLSNEKLTAFEQTAILYRRFGADFSTSDRRAVQELLFLCEMEAYLQDALGRKPHLCPPYKPLGSYFKGQGWQAAEHVRTFLGFAPNGISSNPFRDFRALGIHIFRRRLANSNISGLFLMHPIAGRCIIVNYEEDPYRQRFTLAHEAGHAIMDADSSQPSVSFNNDPKEKIEYRANAFASAFLIPPSAIQGIDLAGLSDDSFLTFCGKFSVNAQPLAYAFQEFNKADAALVKRFANLRVPRVQKPDPELGDDLTAESHARRQKLLERGLSYPYIRLCFDAYREGIISLQRLSEALFLDRDELIDLMKTFGEVPVAP